MVAFASSRADCANPRFQKNRHRPAQITRFADFDSEALRRDSSIIFNWHHHLGRYSGNFILRSNSFKRGSERKLSNIGSILRSVIPAARL